MISRTIKRYSSSSSASARAGIKNVIFGAEQAQTGIAPEELSYQTKTFEDGDASPLGTPLGSRRPSLSSAALSSRRNSMRATLITGGMTPCVPETSARAFSTSAVVASEEHGSYQFTPKETAAVKRRVEEEFMLKNVTRAPLKTRRPEGKVPYEEVAPDGRTLHPSGFVVPEPGDAPLVLLTDHRPRAADINRGIPESVITFADLKEMATAQQHTRSEKVPQEVRAADGTVEHPSGFVPPTPQQAHMSEVKELFKPAVHLPSQN